ncbi:GNAT family N-acetyltransferase [Singulisphaera acidiphila]|uniref:Acetyltransferase n=1 Tax=Singulisphaera acidiphila (strain ATCC BAA-1392 / DSM 18658 / VKM B-2454 / MOB10) TaxID=886293 RepID=L0DK78_SINAD|nr:GNAT family N-acetyltransferase [Singulisphaera acidiphila]AGA29245.1 acetyltransferase [Singulisphaera acidiphila DSM 18658]
MSATAPALLIRAGLPADRDTIIDFNQRLAHETEGKFLDRAVLSAGVDSALADPERLRYWVAQSGSTEPLLGQAAITREWSDWRNGWIWWFQSVYVVPEARSQGVFRALYQQIRAEAFAVPNVIGLRLYVEQENHRAQQTYLAMGMRSGGYHVYEEIWTDRFAAPSA